MKNILYVLTISVLFSCNISYPMEQSITTQKMSMLVCITAACGISLYIANQYKNSILHWFTSLYRKISICKNDDPIDRKPTEIQTEQQKRSSDKNNDSVDTNPTKVQIAQQTRSSEQTQVFSTQQLTPDILDKKTAQYLQKKEEEKQKIIAGTTVLHTACENNDAQKVNLLLQDPNTDINAQRNCIFYWWIGKDEKLGETPLHIACKNRNREIVDLLLRRDGINIAIQNKDGDTPLHIACKSGDLEIVQKLLFCNIPILNEQNRNKETALYFSYFYEHKDIFVLLFKQDNIDLKGLLSLACKRNDMNIIMQLLNHKNITLDDNEPLCIACENGYSDIVTLLLQHNRNNCMDINKLIWVDSERRHYNPLLIACEKIERDNPDRIKFVAIIKSLLNDPYIDINETTHEGFTVFHFAASDYEILQLLLTKDSHFISKKDNLESGCPPFQITPLHNAIKAGNVKCIFLLLKHGANISIQNSDGYTPLSVACVNASKKIQGYQNIVEQLLASTYVNQEIINSSECLYKSIGNEYYESIFRQNTTDSSVPKLLLAYGADPNKKRSSKYGSSSPLLKAAEYDLPLLNVCIDTYKGDCTQQNNKNQTVLYMAFMSEKIKNPNEINFFKSLSENGKQEFMTHELTIVANATPKNIFLGYPQNRKKFNDDIKLFYSFVAACIHYGKIDLNAKISNDITLLDNAYKKSQERYNNFHSSNNSWKKKCMHPKEDICLYTHDTWNDKDDDACDDCFEYFPYNELVMHALVQHITPTTIEHYIDKTIATTYKEEPIKYYSKKPEDKENLKNCMREEKKTHFVT